MLLFKPAYSNQSLLRRLTVFCIRKGVFLLKKTAKFTAAVLIAAFVFLLDGCCDISTMSRQLTESKKETASTERMLEIDDDYYYEHLTDKEKTAYKNIVKNIEKQPKYIMIPDLETSEINDVFMAVSYDHPEIICMGNNCKCVSIGSLSYFQPEYIMSVDECREKTQQMKAVEEKIIGQVSIKSSAFEKELFIHDWLIDNCIYDTAASEDPQVNFSAYTAYGALIEGNATCEGYARAARLLFEKVGIKNHLITGTAKDSKGNALRHMWNIVNLGGKNYNLDITWDDPVINKEEINRHIYFNLSDKDISRDHYGYDKKISDCVSGSENYFVEKGLKFSSYNSDTKERIYKNVFNMGSKKERVLELKFADSHSYRDAINKLFQGGDMYKILDKVNNSLKVKIKKNSIFLSSDDKYYTLYIRFSYAE